MHPHFSLVAKLLAKTSFTYFLLLAMAVFMCTLGIVLSFVALGLSSDSGLGHAAHAGPIVLLFWFVVDFGSACCFFASCLLFPVLYFMTINKYTMSKAMYLLWREKLSGWVSEKISGYISKLEALQPEWFKKTADAAFLKTQLLQTISQDKTTPAVQRKVVRFALKKVGFAQQADDKDYLTLSDMLHHRVQLSLQEIGKPSFKIIGMVMGLHLMVMIAAFIL